MPRTPRYHPDFDADVIGGAEWYAKSSQSLALDFTQKVQDATLALLADPERRLAFEFGLRYWPVVRFPHVILYDLTEAEVLLIGVYHPSQEPHQWLARRG